MRNMPAPPWNETFSPTSRYEMKIKNTGVSARNGRVRLRGETLKAFIYRIIVTISRGRAIAKAL